LSKKAWLTKSSIPTRADFVVTLPDDEEWLADFLGAFLLLGERDNWEVQSGLTADEMSAEWFALFMLFATGRQLAIPPGVVVPFAGDEIPAGWLLADGSEVSRSTYAALFASIGTTYGNGNGTTTFDLPSLSGRVAVGYYPELPELGDVGDVGGARVHALSVGELPVHTHVQNAHTHVVSVPNNVIPGTAGTYAAMEYRGWNQANPQFNPTYTSGSATPTNQNTGSGEAHENMPPYIVLNYIIKF